MKKTFILLLTFFGLLSSSLSWAQTQIYVLDFENTGGYTTSDLEQTDGSANYFARTYGNDIDATYNTPQGSYFFVAQDLDADGMSSPATLSIDDIDISGYTNLELRIYIAEDDDGSNQNWDAEDYLHIDYDIDNSGTFSNGIWVENDGSDYNSAPFIDTDYDDVGDGTEITDTFAQFTKSISTTGSLLDIEITFGGLISSEEDIAIDHIEIWGIPSGPTITVTPTALTGFTYLLNNGPSAEQTYTVEGSNLTDDIVISPPLNWEISTTSGDSYQTTDITLTQTSGTVSATNIYIRMVEGLLATNSPFSGVVVHESTDATQVDLNVSGTVTNFLECTVNNEIIGQQDFDSSTPTWNYTSDGTTDASYGNTDSGLRIDSEDSLTTDTIDVSGKTNIKLTVKTASDGGIENADTLEFYVDIDGNGYPATPDIKIQEEITDDGYYNKTWDYTATGVATTIAGTPATFNGDGATGYATVEISIPDGTSTIALKIVSATNNSGEYFYIDDIKLTGDLTDSTTWDGSAWSNGEPTSTTKAIFDGDYTTTSTTNIEACACQVTSNATVTVVAATYLDIQNEIVNEGMIIIDETGAIVQHNNDSTVTGDGLYQTTVKTTSMDDARYTYFSSPTQTDTMDVFSSWAATDRMFGWDGTNQVWSAVTTATAMTPGLGYIVRPTTTASFPAQFTTNFEGAFNNGIVTSTLYNTDVYSGTDDDSSLIGNPYPSAIDTQALLDANTDTDAFYFWTHSTGTDWSSEDYAVYNSSGSTGGAPATIATGQGFFVTSTASGDFTFNNNLRITGNNDTFLRPANNLDKVWLNVVANTNAGSQLLLGFIPNKTDGFDAQYDAKRMNSTENSISFSSNGTDANTANLAIQARNVLSDDDTIIPLNIFINDATIQTATISIDHLENLTDRNIFLKDNVLNTLTDLKQGDYQFTVSQTGVINDRFEIVFSRNALAVNENTVSTDIIITQKDDYITLNTSNNSKIKTVSLYNMLGQELVNTNVLQIPTTNYQAGTVLIIRATLTNGTVVTKKLIKM